MMSEVTVRPTNNHFEVKPALGLGEEPRKA